MTNLSGTNLVARSAAGGQKLWMVFDTSGEGYATQKLRKRRRLQLISIRILRTACMLILLMLVISGARATPTIWKQLKPGLEYTLLQPGYGRLYAFRIDPAQYDVDLAIAGDLDHPGTSGLSVEEIAQQTHALVAINGGFFTPNYRPLGLRIQNGQLRSPFKPISWWGVFYLKNYPGIISSKAFKDLQNITFAIQAGPRLVVQGEIPRLKSGEDERSAICLTRQQQVILVVSQGASLTLSKFADLLRKPEQFGGLNCYNALNLDGGHSSQLFAKIGPNELSVPNLSPVADAVIVKPRIVIPAKVSSQKHSILSVNDRILSVNKGS